MEVTAISLRLSVMLLFNSFWLLPAQGQNNDTRQEVGGIFLRIHPNRRQFFEYANITLDCAGSHEPTEWRVMKTQFSNSPRWESSYGTMIIKHAYEQHSGEYLCENKGKKSKTVNISVTAGDVILESPAMPVTVGDTVSLYCRKRGHSSKLPADFYKDGIMIYTGYTGQMVIPNITMSDEGFYKCSIVESQSESPESWLDVTLHIPPSHQEKTPEDDLQTTLHPFLDPSNSGSMTLSVVLVVFTFMAVLLPVLGLLQCRKHRDCQEENVAEFTKVLYTVTKKKDNTGSTISD